MTSFLFKAKQNTTGIFYKIRNNKPLYYTGKAICIMRELSHYDL